MLHERGFSLALLSSHKQANLEREAAFLGIGGLFREINGSALDKIEAIGGLLKRNNFAPEETMFVGDMTHDIEAGKAAGVTTCAILWERARYLYEPLTKIELARPDHIITDIRSLMEIIQK